MMIIIVIQILNIMPTPLYTGTSVSNIQQTCQVKKKDIRKFLDGIYRSERNVMSGK